jgi:hypothetical protein
MTLLLAFCDVSIKREIVKNVKKRENLILTSRKEEKIKSTLKEGLNAV